MDETNRIRTEDRLDVHRVQEPKGLEKNGCTRSLDLDNALKGFSKLTREERFSKLLDLMFISEDEYFYLKNDMPVDPTLADHFIENSLGFHKLPLGVAVNFKINGIDKIIPMAVEETSIIAAASKTAKWIKQNGEITTRSIGKEIIGQIQIAKSINPHQSINAVLANKDTLIAKGNVLASGMAQRGGGVRDIVPRILDRKDGSYMLVFHVLMDPCDAMGANIINQVCEGLRPDIEAITGERVAMCILSNLVDTKITEARVVIKNIDPVIGKGIEEASFFAQIDPYRAATNNKGVMNGIDAVLIATGNDWRAVEAGVHAFCAIQGQYTSVTKWKMQGNDLVGILQAPIIVGTVGGVTKLHPIAQMCLRILEVDTAEELAQIAAASGLVQNLGALRALSGIGIVKGHMKLHAANLALQAGALPSEMEEVQNELQEFLDKNNKISVKDAEFILEKNRKRNG